MHIKLVAFDAGAPTAISHSFVAWLLPFSSSKGIGELRAPLGEIILDSRLAQCKPE